MDRLRDAAAETFARHGGQPVGTANTELAARFDGPARAVRCALALREAAVELEIELAAGIHVGEIEIRDDSVTGVALHIAGQISSRAAAGEVLVSGIVVTWSPAPVALQS
jgi:class 3 adenylate cyclase